MDEMQDYEVSYMVESIEYSDRNLWEMARLIMYQNIQMNSKKTIDIKNVIKFKWDIEQEEETQEISNSEIERLKARADAISQQIQKNNT